MNLGKGFIKGLLGAAQGGASAFSEQQQEKFKMEQLLKQKEIEANLEAALAQQKRVQGLQDKVLGTYLTEPFKTSPAGTYLSVPEGFGDELGSLGFDQDTIAKLMGGAGAPRKHINTLSLGKGPNLKRRPATKSPGASIPLDANPNVIDLDI